jgi:inhibitor of growth protein 3
VANLPAEIAHLLEEIQAKEVIIQDCLKNVARCDNSLQKFYKTSGPLTAHPKEDGYCKQVEQHYARAQKLQEEKVVLSEKAGVLVSRVPVSF